MAEAGRLAVREPGLDTPRAYARRVHALAAIYGALFVSSLAGLAVIVWKAQLFVTLSQRSNVETLVLAFFFIFFLYVALVSRSGAAGALHIGYFALRRLWASSPHRRPRPYHWTNMGMTTWT